MVGAGGLVASIIVFAVGAILDFAVTASPDQHGFNVNKVGVILMIVGAVGAVLSLIAMLMANTAVVEPSLTTSREMWFVELIPPTRKEPRRSRVSMVRRAHGTSTRRGTDVIGRQSEE